MGFFQSAAKMKYHGLSTHDFSHGLRGMFNKEHI